jgi:peptide/nickel transport system ATP-binding protein
VLLDGAPLPASLSRAALISSGVQIVFQNADTALNPAHSVRQTPRPLAFHHGARAMRHGAHERLLDLVRLLAGVGEAGDGPVGGKTTCHLARAPQPS